MLPMLSEVDAAVCERSRLRRLWEAIIQKYVDDRLCSGVSDRPEQHFRCCGMRSVHWLVRICRPTTFLMRLEEFIHKMHFFLPLFSLTSSERKNFFLPCIKKGSSDAKLNFTSCLNINVCTHPSYNDKNPPSVFFF